MEEANPYFRSTNPSLNEIYAWIRNNTDESAVFIDGNRADIAFFAGRTVFYADVSRTHVLGWYLPYQFLGYTEDQINNREEIVSAIYSARLDKVNNVALSEFENVALEHDIYIVVRKGGEGPQELVASISGVEEAFSNDFATIYSYVIL